MAAGSGSRAFVGPRSGRTLARHCLDLSVGNVSLQRDGAVAGSDKSLDHVEKLMEFIGVQAVELYVIYPHLCRCETLQQVCSGARDGETQPAPVDGMRRFLDQTFDHEPVRDRRDECPAQIDVVRNCAYMDVAGRGKMPD